MKNILKVLRAQHNLSQNQLAKEVGITRPALSKIETGESIPSGITMIRIANYFGIPAEQIFFEDAVNQDVQ